nr:DUF2887 domain-containing protein [Planktothricoides sp. SR001]
MEQSDTHPYRALLNSDQVHRVYLNELGEIRQLPIGIALMVLTILKEEQTPEEARYLLDRVQREVPEQKTNRAIIDTIATILLYKFTNLTRREVEAMLGMQLQETRVYREAKEEGREEGRQQEAVNLLLRQLSRRCGNLSDELTQRLSNLPLSVLEDLSEALLDFSSLDDLLAWLEAH